jgi:hypothetical protein
MFLRRLNANGIIQMGYTKGIFLGIIPRHSELTNPLDSIYLPGGLEHPSLFYVGSVFFFIGFFMILKK